MSVWCTRQLASSTQRESRWKGVLEASGDAVTLESCSTSSINSSTQIGTELFTFEELETRWSLQQYVTVTSCTQQQHASDVTGTHHARVKLTFAVRGASDSVVPPIRFCLREDSHSVFALPSEHPPAPQCAGYSDKYKTQNYRAFPAK